MITPTDETQRLLHQSSSLAAPETDKSVKYGRYILLSTTLTCLGSRSWEFATPLLLLAWSPGSLATPAALGLTCSFVRTTISPWLGVHADAWENRFHVVLLGIGMQSFGCALSVCALVLWNKFFSEAEGMRVPMLTLVICAGAIETIGAQLSRVAVKKEWVPIVFDENVRGDKSNHCRKPLCPGLGLPPVSLSFINTTMTNIDLLCAMTGPVLAGWILEIFGKGTSDEDCYSIRTGFFVIGMLNVLSFVPEILLLQRVYQSCHALQHRQHQKKDQKKKEETEQLNIDEADTPAKQRDNPWLMWLNHPSGLPLLSLSLASLYLTALSPNGVVLTAFLVSIGLSPTCVGLFRSIGSLSGVIGIALFSVFRKTGEAVDSESERSESSVRSIEHLRKLSMAFLLLEVLSILFASAAFYLYETAGTTLFASTTSDSNSDGLSWQIVVFLAAIIVSRAGLYSFDVGALEIEQYIVDQRYRNAVGATEGALCSMAEMGMYLLSILVPDPAHFSWQVFVSATAVTTGGVCFASFLCLYHMHGHHHHLGDEGLDGSHQHNHNHVHTWQQEHDLKETGYHIHLHRSSLSLHCFPHRNRLE